MVSKDAFLATRTDAPDFVGKMYQERLRQGFEPRQVVIRPDRPMHRIIKYYEPGVLDYNSVELPFLTKEEADYAREFLRVLGRLSKFHGPENVSEECLPNGFLVNPGYPGRMHRLMMVLPAPSGCWLETAIARDIPRSPSEAIAGK